MQARRVVLAGLVLLAIILALAGRFAPGLTFSLSLAAPSTEKWFATLGERVVRENITLPTRFAGLQADLYRPARHRGALLLVHGLSRAGRRQPDLARLAHLLASHGALVVVPQFDGLAAFRLSGREVDQVRAALDYVATLSTSVGIAGFSFGAGPALLAAADVPGLRVVGSFGGYADLTHVIGFVTTGSHAFQGRRYVQHQETYNRWKLLALLVGFLQDPDDRTRLDEMAHRKLAYPDDDTREIEASLGPEGRALLAVVQNRREDAVTPLLVKLPEGARDALRRLSPLAAVPRIHARLLIAHGMGDDSIPFTESWRLADAAGSRAHLALFRTFHHTGPRALWPSVIDGTRDGWTLFRLADELLPQ
jgi:dienelactone hydrolase